MSPKLNRTNYSTVPTSESPWEIYPRAGEDGGEPLWTTSISWIFEIIHEVVLGKHCRAM
jgi:hypothetical protein